MAVEVEVYLYREDARRLYDDLGDEFVTPQQLAEVLEKLDGVLVANAFRVADAALALQALRAAGWAVAVEPPYSYYCTPPRPFAGVAEAEAELRRLGVEVDGELVSVVQARAA